MSFDEILSFLLSRVCVYYGNNNISVSVKEDGTLIGSCIAVLAIKKRLPTLVFLFYGHKMLSALVSYNSKSMSSIENILNYRHKIFIVFKL